MPGVKAASTQPKGIISQLFCQIPFLTIFTYFAISYFTSSKVFFICIYVVCHFYGYWNKGGKGEKMANGVKGPLPKGSKSSEFGVDEGW